MAGRVGRDAVRRDASAPPRTVPSGFADVMAASALRSAKEAKDASEFKSASSSPVPLHVPAPNFNTLSALREVKRSDLPAPDAGGGEADGARGRPAESKERGRTRSSSKPASRRPGKPGDTGIASL